MYATVRCGVFFFNSYCYDCYRHYNNHYVSADERGSGAVHTKEQCSVLEETLTVIY
jgi:hypothetical protein